jgi:hypothetical protein
MIPILHPSNRAVITWRGFTCLFIMFEIFTITVKLFFRLSWDQNFPILGVQDIIIKTALIIDILLILNTGVYQSGTVVLSRKLIFKEFFRRAMLQDLISILVLFLPYFNPDNFDTNKPALLLSSNNLIKLLFIFKLKNVKMVLQVLEETLYFDETYEATLSLIKLILQVLFIAHWICCLWNLAAWIEIEKGNENWQTKAFYDGYDKSLVHWSREYLYASYWSLTTMITVGYGDISPKSDLEIIVSSLAMLFGCGFFAYAINSIGLIVEKFDLKHKNLR